MDDLRVSVDIGSEKTVLVLVGMETPRQALCFAEIETRGLLRHGVIAAMDELSETVARLKAAAENKFGKVIPTRVNCCLSGGFFHFPEAGRHVEVDLTRGVVTERDVNHLTQQNCESRLAEGLEMLHFEPRDYILDGCSRISDPVGQSGGKLAMNAAAVVVHSNTLKNFGQCLVNGRLEPASFSFAPLVAAKAVLRPEEIEAGVAYLDLGSSVTTILVFHAGLVGIRTYDLGGCLIAQFLARRLRTLPGEARRLIREHGSCRLDVSAVDEVPVRDLDGGVTGMTSRLEIARVIEAEYRRRMVPHLKSVFSGFQVDPGAGVVIGGGGAALEGLAALLGKQLMMPVRVGRVNDYAPLPGELASPRFHAALGGVESRWCQGRVSGQEDGKCPSFLRPVRRFGLSAWEEITGFCRRKF